MMKEKVGVKEHNLKTMTNSCLDAQHLICKRKNIILTAIVFIRTIATVILAIAAPYVGYASEGVATLELSLWTRRWVEGGGGAGTGFITTIPTVLHTITVELLSKQKSKYILGRIKSIATERERVQQITNYFTILYTVLIYLSTVQ